MIRSKCSHGDLGGEDNTGLVGTGKDKGSKVLGETEANIVAPVVRDTSTAVSRAHEPRTGAPGTAAHHTQPSCVDVDGVSLCRFIVLVQAPLPDVAGQVKGTTGPRPVRIYAHYRGAI